MTVKNLSASAIKKFNRCELMFKHKYVDRVDYREEESKHIKIGNIVHESIENVLNDVGMIEDVDLLENAFLDEREQLKDEYPLEEKESAEKVNTCLKTAAKFISKQLSDQSITSIEEEWSMEDKHGIEWIGYSDLVVEDTIIDWKTGKMPEDGEKERVQAGVYIELAKEELGIVPDKVVFVYLAEGEANVRQRVVNGREKWSESHSEYWDEIQSVVSEIVDKDENEFEKTADSSSVCYYCDYKLYCPAYVGSGNVEPYQIEIGSSL